MRKVVKKGSQIKDSETVAQVKDSETLAQFAKVEEVNFPRAAEAVQVQAQQEVEKQAEVQAEVEIFAPVSSIQSIQQPASAVQETIEPEAITKSEVVAQKSEEVAAIVEVAKKEEAAIEAVDIAVKEPEQIKPVEKVEATQSIAAAIRRRPRKHVRAEKARARRNTGASFSNKHSSRSWLTGDAFEGETAKEQRNSTVSTISGAYGEDDIWGPVCGDRARKAEQSWKGDEEDYEEEFEVDQSSGDEAWVKESGRRRAFQFGEVAKFGSDSDREDKESHLEYQRQKRGQDRKRKQERNLNVNGQSTHHTRGRRGRHLLQ